MKFFTCIAVVSCMVLGVLSVPGDDYKTARTYVRQLALTDQNIRDTFLGLDVAGSTADGKIDNKDLELLFWHGESKFAKAKFLKYVDKDANGVVTKEELTMFMTKESTVLATIECRYVKSISLREQCFSDQVLTYIYLVLGKTNVKEFYNYIECKGDDDKVIRRNDVEVLTSKGLTDVDNFLEELGGNDKDGITEEEFEDYVTQEAISDDFRHCRKSVDECTGDAEYNMDCLTRELVEYTQDDLTEMDIALTFKSIDVNGGGIDVSDLMHIKGINEALANRIIKLLDHSKNSKIDYAEFRTYLKSPTVNWRLEKECTEPKKTQDAELSCIKELISTLFKDMHKPIWFVVPDLDMLFTFEEIDISNNGFIEVEDLKSWDATAKARFIKEMDGLDKNQKIDLEEFTEYVDIPHVAYGVGDCQQHKKDQSRVICYISELQDVFKHMIPNENIQEFFGYYTQKTEELRITVEELTVRFPEEKERNYFLSEVGMGDEVITHFEFVWYVKQQELSTLFVNKKDLSKESLHNVVKEYISNRMTEFNIEETFAKLDTDGNHELDSKDFPNSPKWPNLVQYIDNHVGHDRYESANFVEFWVWIHMKKETTTRKVILEEKCTSKHLPREQEVQCYANGIIKVKEEGGLDLF